MAYAEGSPCYKPYTYGRTGVVPPNAVPDCAIITQSEYEEVLRLLNSNISQKKARIKELRSLDQVVINPLPRLVSSRSLTIYCVCGGELGVFSSEYSPTRSVLGVRADACSLAARWLGFKLVDSAGMLLIGCGG